MNITKDQWTAIARTILVALLAICTIVGYDLGVIQPREALIAARSQPLTRGVSHFTELEADTVKAAAPTAIGTATPAMIVDSLGVSNLFEVRDAATPVFTVNDGGAVSWPSGNLAVTAPTAVATATPALVVDTTGVSNLFELRAASTPVWYTTAAGNTTGSGTFSVEDIASTDDGSVADDFTITDDLIGTGLINWAPNEEHIGLPSVISTTVAYTPTSGTIATVGASELWLVHAVYANVTTDWDTAGNNDATLDIGDGSDADGLLDLDDAELQAADTEGTGAPAGWQGFMSTDARGAYLANGHGFIYSSGDTIDYACGGTAADAGAATIYVVYTRVY